MNNQWTPSGAYNGGVLQSSYPQCLTLPLFISVQSFTFHLNCFFCFSPPTHAALPPDSSWSFIYSPLLFTSIYLSLLHSHFPCILRDPQWPPWQASRGIPHSNSVVQPSRRLIRWPCALKRHSLLWVIVTLSLVRVCLKCCKSAPIIQCKRTPGLGISRLNRTYTEPFGLLFSPCLWAITVLVKHSVMLHISGLIYISCSLTLDLQNW